MNHLKSPAVYLPLAFLIALGIFSFACDCEMHRGAEYERRRAEWREMRGRIPLPERNIVDVGEGYLGSSYECECGYIPAIAHPSYRDCIEYLKRKAEECK